MRQKEDKEFAERLNRLRVATCTPEDHTFFQSLKCPNIPLPKTTTMHLFSTNKQVEAFNENLFKQTSHERVHLLAHDSDLSTFPPTHHYQPLCPPSVNKQYTAALLHTLSVYITCVVQIVASAYKIIGSG